MIKENELVNAWENARMMREDGELEQARKAFESIREHLASRASLDRESLARAEYELAFIAALKGEYESAADLFRQSGATASRAGDEAGDIVGRFRAVLTEYLGGLKSAADVYPDFIDLRREIEHASSNRQEFHRRWCFNIDKRLLK